MDFMKKLIAIFLVLSLISCKKEVPKTEIKKEKVPETKVWVSKNQKFLDQFKTVDFDTLKVYSAEDIYDEKFEYKGKLLNITDSIFFPKEISIFDMNKVDAYAVYKFDIDKNNLGLIARVGGEYDASSVKFFNYNKQKEIITDYRQLADFGGDAGDIWETKSWIFKNNQLFNFFVWEKFEHDNSVDEKPKLPNYKENHYFLLQFNNGKLDTISKNNEQLEKQFSKIIKKESL